MSKPPSPDQKLEQITESLSVHNLMRGLPDDVQHRLRQIALRKKTSIMQVARDAILTFTQPRPNAA